MAVEVRGLTPLISVFDMATSLRFYRDVLGFTIAQDTGQKDDSDWVMLESNGVALMLNTMYERGTRPNAPDPSRFSVHEDTYLYFSCPDPDTTYEFLKSNGIVMEPPAVAYYGMRQLYVRDPDGYTLCFQCPAKK